MHLASLKNKNRLSAMYYYIYTAQLLALPTVAAEVWLARPYIATVPLCNGFAWLRVRDAAAQ
jgi:hypothetical protein